MDFIAYIKKLSKEKNMTMYQLSKASGISQSTLSNIVNRGNNPSVYTLQKICKGLQISMADFFLICEEQEAPNQLNLFIQQYLMLNTEEKECIQQMMKLLLTRY